MIPKKYDYIRICLGYPELHDNSKIIWRKWNGVKKGIYETGLFGKKEVYAIDVTELIYSDQHLAPSVFFKDVLNLNLKREYWEKISRFEKPFEFREIKPYWTKRLFEPQPDKE